MRRDEELTGRDVESLLETPNYKTQILQFKQKNNNESKQCYQRSTNHENHSKSPPNRAIPNHIIKSDNKIEERKHKRKVNESSTSAGGAAGVAFELVRAAASNHRNRIELNDERVTERDVQIDNCAYRQRAVRHTTATRSRRRAHSQRFADTRAYSDPTPARQQKQR